MNRNVRKRLMKFYGETGLLKPKADKPRFPCPECDAPTAKLACSDCGWEMRVSRERNQS